MKAGNRITLPPDGEEKLLGLFVRDRAFYRRFFPLLFVICLQQLAALAVNMADNIMLGRYSELSLSGATLVNQIQFVLQQIASGTGMGIVALSSQYWGRKEIRPIRRIISLGVKFGLLTGLVFFLAARLIPRQLLSLFTNDEAVIAEGLRYLRVISWTYLIFGLSNSLMYSLQSVETAGVGTVMSVSTLIINVCLNSLLIYGKLGAPELGIVGAAIATLVSRTVELIIILSYVLLIDKKLKMKAADLLRFDFGYWKDFLKVSMPIVLSGALWGVAQGAQTSVLGHIGAAVIAANSIALAIFQMFAVVGFSCTNAASVTIGKTIGERQFHKLRAYTKTLQGILLIVGVVFGSLILICKDAIIGFYTVSDETRRLASHFLTVMGITTVGTCYEFPVESGIIGGGGNTRYAAITDNLFMWLFTIPSAVLSAFVFRWRPEVTFFLLKADQLLKCIPNSIYCNSFRWVRILTRHDSNEQIMQ